MTGHRRRLLAATLLVGVAAPNAGLRLVLDDARDRRDGAEAAQQAAEAREDAFAQAEAATAAAVGGVLAEAATTWTAAFGTEATAAEVATDAAVRREELAAIGLEVARNQSQFDALRAVIEARSGQVEDLRACVSGVGTAATASRRGDTAAVVAAMQAVAEACRRAQGATEAVDPTARFPYDFPDPYVLATSGGYYAYATNSAGGAIQLLRSDDLVSWSFAGTALRSVPGWAVGGATWAPSVVARPNQWVLYYAVRHRDSGRQCISAATGAGPAGPFTDSSAGPLVCELGEGGSIDPSPFVAPDGTAYLLWKSEGETAGAAAALRSQRLSADGLGLAGSPTTLAVADQTWEGRTVEGPSMLTTAGGLVLLYSANRWDRAAYAVGAARCDTPLGPCHKVAGPVLVSSGLMTGPGGAEGFTDRGGRSRVVFHAWQGDEIGYPNHRYLHIGTLSTSAGTVSLTVD